MEQLTDERRQEIRDAVLGMSVEFRTLKNKIDDYFYNVDNFLERLNYNIPLDEAIESLNEVHNLLLTIQEQLFEL